MERTAAGAPACSDRADGPTLDDLRQRWETPGPNGSSARDQMLERFQDLREADSTSRASDPAQFHRADLRAIDLAGADLAGLDLSGADLRDAVLLGTCLRGATLFKARLDRAELTGADLEGSNLEHATLRGAGLGGAQLTQARFFEADLEGASLTGAVAHDADFRMAKLVNARLAEADLKKADLTGADLRHADLSYSDVEGTVFNEADLRHARPFRICHSEKALWIGADTREIDWVGCHILRRFILDQNYIEEFRKQDRLSGILYKLWSTTSDCGRSLARWSLFMFIISLLFAGVYTLVDVDYGDNETWLSPFYFSIVTMTTLGYGDVCPASLIAQAAVILQVVTGFIGLGGTLAIFSNKLARRAD